MLKKPELGLSAPYQHSRDTEGNWIGVQLLAPLQKGQISMLFIVKGEGGEGRSRRKRVEEVGKFLRSGVCKVADGDRGEQGGGGREDGRFGGWGEGEGGVGFGVEGERESKEVKVEEVGKKGWLEKKEEVMVVKEEVVCIPPKNALLLMRCRFDPIKMAALTSRLFGSPATKVQEEKEEEEEEEKSDGNEERKEIGKHLVVEESGEGDGQESNDELETDAEEISQKTGEEERRACETQRSLEG